MSNERMHWRSWLLAKLLVLLAAGAARAQVPNDDHLVPPVGSLTELPIISRYHALLHGRLGLDSARLAGALVVVQPSFEAEYALWVERSGPAFRLVYRVAQRSIWGSMAQAQPGGAISTRRLALSPTLAQGLTDALNAALAQTRYPVGQKLGSDGTTYLFVTNTPNLGTRSGETWSPAPATCMAALAHLTETLRELATTADHQQFRQDVLLTETQQLLRRLAAH